MIAAAVEFYDVVVWLHIVATLLAFGPTFAYGVFFATAGNMNPAAAPTIGRAVITWSRIATRGGIAVILLSGIFLVANYDFWEFSDFFISWGIVAVLILFAMSQWFFIPTTEKFVEAAEAGRQEEAMALAGRQQIGGPIAGILVILTIYVMTAQPFQ